MPVDVDLQYIENVLTQILSPQKDTITIAQINEVVHRFQSNLKYREEHIEHLIKRLETRFSTTMDKGVSLIDLSQEHNEDWHLADHIKWEYWHDYEQYLNQIGWSSRVIKSLDSVTTKILGLLTDPTQSGEWERRGLVIGHVQSGKTSNYIGLIAKAADAGYKFIIVIAGIHNNLRTQTQERIDAGFIGRDSKTKQPVGVGQIRRSRSAPVTVTTTESDFNKRVAKQFGMELKSLNNTFILVIKKNTATLKALYQWLKGLNVKYATEKITDIPMLLIDDEADNASINTNKEGLDPTKTNAEIRRILSLFKKRCYVGYTATPFANIFIDPGQKTDELGEELFPEHFIYSLDAPNNYFGAERIFLDEENSDKYIRIIEDAEEWVPLIHAKDDSVGDLPDTLREAIHLFVLSRAIRNLRDQREHHCSMLVNVTRFVAVQREVRDVIQMYLDSLKNAIRFNYMKSTDDALKDELMLLVFKDFTNQYNDVGVDWGLVQAELNEAVHGIKIFIVNSKSEELLDYRAYAKDGNALTAIVVGGLSLSRGLTIEGLTISYIYRNSKMYDTLMQMGRWFGYRYNYEDLCRVYMSDESRGWYTYIADAIEGLREQIIRMRREGKNPRDFGLYVKAHPDTLMVTALNKMRHTDKRKFDVSYDGKLVETFILPLASDKNADNTHLIRTFYEGLQNNEVGVRDRTTSIFFADIKWEIVHEFTLRFKFHDDMSDLAHNIPAFIQEVTDLYPRWDVAFRSLSGTKPPDGYMIAPQKRDIGHDKTGKPRQPTSEEGWFVGNKNRFSGNSMFDIGLSAATLSHAQQAAADAGRKVPIYRDYTNARDKPILLIHLLNLVDKSIAPDESVAELIPAISVSFPNGTELRTVEYVVNPVWLKQFEQDNNDLAQNEDDYDYDS